MNVLHGLSYRALAWGVGIAFVGLPAFTLVAIVTGEWRWLIGAAVCWACVRGLFR